MSALWAATEPIRDRRPATGRPNERVRARLRAVPDAPPRMARMPFMGVLIAVFGLGMAGLLMLNTTLQNQTFEARQLTREATALTYSQADLEGRLAELAAPQELARRASELGMRPNPNPAQLELPSGDIVGKAVPLTGKDMALLVVKSPAEIAKDKAAAAAKKAAAAAKKRADQARKAAAERQRQLQAAQARTDAQLRAAAARKAAQTKAAQTKAAQSKAAQQKPASTGQAGRR